MRKVQIVVILKYSLRANGICRIFEKLNVKEEFDISIPLNNGSDLLLSGAAHSDIVFIDNNLDLICRREFITKLNNENPVIKIICMAELENDIAARYLFTKGVRGIISVKAEEEEFRDAVLAVLKNRYYYKNELSKNELSNFIKNFPTLSDREYEVFTLQKMNHCNNEIAAKLNISPKTVKNHKHNINKKIKNWDF